MEDRQEKSVQGHFKVANVVMGSIYSKIFSLRSYCFFFFESSCEIEYHVHTKWGKSSVQSEVSAVAEGACVSSSAEYGGLGLDFSYSVAVSEELGHIRCGGIPMAIGVQTDMATPALARYNQYCYVT